MSLYSVTERVLACGHRWSLKNPRRCGLCDCCPDCCKCDQDGTRAMAAEQISTLVRTLHGRRPKRSNQREEAE